MTAGRLAGLKASATTNTTLYRCPISKATSAALEVCNQSGTAATYRLALRNYDQILTLNSAYTFAVGNIISNYKLTISPGIPTTDFTPGDVVTLDNNQGSFKIQDIYQDTSTITYLTKVASVGPIVLDSANLTGTFAVGNTITGGTTGQTATIYRAGTGNLYVNVPAVTSSSTSHKINSNTGVAVNDYIYTDTEIMRISAITGYTVTVTRGQLTTTAKAHNPGTAMTIFRASATTTTINEGAVYSATDTALTVASSTNFTVGSYIKIDNEFLKISAINGTTLTVSRGEFGTTAATHADGSVVTQQTTVTTGHFAFFALSETITNGSGASVPLNISALSGDAFTPTSVFVYNDGAGGAVYSYPASIPVNGDRVIKFDQSDSSNATHPLRISLNSDGTNSAGGINLTTGVTVSGTPGSAGAYTQVDLNLDLVSTNSTYYTYDSSTSGYGTSIAIDTTPNYTDIFVHDPTKAKITTSDTFALANVDYTITGVTLGTYGYVTEVVYPGVSAITTTAATGAAGTATLTFAAQSSAPFAVGQTITVAGITPSGYNGTYVVTACTTTTVSYANATTAAQTVAGTIVGNSTIKVALGKNSSSIATSETFYDSPLQPASTRSLATVSSVSAINVDDYIFYDKSVAANTTDRTTGIVVGPGDSIMVYSSAAALSYVLHGFEDTTTDFTPIYYIRQRSTGL